MILIQISQITNPPKQCPLDILIPLDKSFKSEIEIGIWEPFTFVGGSKRQNLNFIIIRFFNIKTILYMTNKTVLKHTIFLKDALQIP